jgi:hypothetical protein
MSRSHILTILLTCFAPFAGFAQVQPAADKAAAVLERAAGTYSLELKNVDIREAVDKLKTLLDVPICFEMEELDPSTQGITARERVRLMRESGADPASIAPYEAIAKEHPGSNVGWKLPRYDFVFKDAKISGILEQIFNSFKNYSYSFDNTFLVISPKSSALNFPVGKVDIKDKTLGAVLEEYRPLFLEKKIGVMGPMGQMPGMANPMQSQIDQINLESPTAAILLTRLCQGSSPIATWSLLGMKGSRILTFYPLQSNGR